MSIFIKGIIIAMVHIAEASTIHAYANYLFNAKRSKLSTSFAFFAGYATLYLIFMLLDNQLINLLSNFVITTVILYTTFSCGFVSASFQSAVLTAFMMLSEVTTSIIISLFSQDYSAYTYRPSVLAAIGIISKLLNIFFCFLSARLFTPHKSGITDNRSMLKLCALPIASSCVAFTVFYICILVDLPFAVQIAVSICLAILLFANIYTISIYSNTEKINRDNLSMKLALQKDESDAEYYKMLQDQYDRQRILVHDIKNHMQIVNNLAAEGRIDEIQSYIEEWGFDKGLQKQTRYCENAILNIIVSKLAKDCDENGIRFFCDIRDKSIDFIDDIDISALFGNLLSNAFEAAKESEEKVIELDIHIKHMQKVTVIKVMNSCKEKPEKSDGGFLVSRKKDKENHGLGQKSIARIVKKYNGQAENYYDEDKKQFDWVIVLSEQ